MNDKIWCAEETGWEGMVEYSGVENGKGRGGEGTME